MIKDSDDVSYTLIKNWMQWGTEQHYNESNRLGASPDRPSFRPSPPPPLSPLSLSLYHLISSLSPLSFSLSFHIYIYIAWISSPLSLPMPYTLVGAMPLVGTVLADMFLPMSMCHWLWWCFCVASFTIADGISRNLTTFRVLIMKLPVQSQSNHWSARCWMLIIHRVSKMWCPRSLICIFIS